MIIILSSYRTLHVMQELENLCQKFSCITDPSEQQLLILCFEKYVCA